MTNVFLTILVKYTERILYLQYLLVDLKQVLTNVKIAFWRSS